MEATWMGRIRNEYIRGRAKGGAGLEINYEGGKVETVWTCAVGKDSR